MKDFTLIKESLPAAHIFNFSAPVGYGLVVDEDFLHLRPNGHVFSMFSGLAEAQQLATTVTGAATLTTTVNGIIPNHLH